MPDTFTDTHRVEITSLAARHRLPAVYPYRQFTAVGGLLSYGDDLIDNFRRAPTYVDCILKGAKPNEIPVQAPIKFELVINLKTEDARPRGAACAARPRRRGDRIEVRVAAVHESGYGTKRKWGDVRYSAAIGGKAEVT